MEVVACCPCGRSVPLIDYPSSFHTSDHSCIRELCLMNANIGITGYALFNIRLTLLIFLCQFKIVTEWPCVCTFK